MTARRIYAKDGADPLDVRPAVQLWAKLSYIPVYKFDRPDVHDLIDALDAELGRLAVLAGAPRHLIARTIKDAAEELAQ